MEQRGPEKGRTIIHYCYFWNKTKENEILIHEITFIDTREKILKVMNSKESWNVWESGTGRGECLLGGSKAESPGRMDLKSTREKLGPHAPPQCPQESQGTS